MLVVESGPAQRVPLPLPYYKLLSTKSPLYLYTKSKGVQEDKHYKTRFVINQKRNQSIVLGEESQAGCDAANTGLQVSGMFYQ